jgi:hypothetical protein
MRSKGPVIVKLGGDSIAFDGVRRETRSAAYSQEALSALQSNIEATLSEIETLRGSLQYWEGRPPAADPREREMLDEAFRVIHGELIGLTARAKELAEATAGRLDEG